MEDGLLSWEMGYPRLQWDLVESTIPAEASPQQRYQVWLEAYRQWLSELAAAISSAHTIFESRHFIAVAPSTGNSGPLLVSFAEHCRKVLLSVVDNLADLRSPCKYPIVAFNRIDLYQPYADSYGPGGLSSSGFFIGEGAGHVAVLGVDIEAMEPVLAHELMHAALYHLPLPAWLNEGLALMFEHNACSARLPRLFDAEDVWRHKEYWGENGLGEFWSGDGFHGDSDVQELCYELAEIAVRLLVERSQPGLFGLNRRRQRQLIGFIREASHADYGELACQEHLGCGLGDLVATFLGPGDWSPQAGYDRAWHDGYETEEEFR
jgi:hypothetical protein